LDLVGGSSSKDVMFRPREYTLVKRLGCGQFGETYLSRSVDGNQCVMKRMGKNSANFRWIYVEREEMAGTRLNGDPGIISCMLRFETVHNVYLVFPFFDGRDLIAYLEDRNFWPLEDKHAKKLFKQLAVALSYCHSKGIGHRDVKLDNILINKNGQIKLIDFGLCTVGDSTTNMQDDRVGSIDYAAPEILLGKLYNSFKADIFSAGVVLYCLLFGKFPFVGEERLSEIRQGFVRRIFIADKKDKFAAISEDAKNVLQLMLDTNPGKRPSAHDLMKHKWLAQK